VKHLEVTTDRARRGSVRARQAHRAPAGRRHRAGGGSV